MPSAGGDLSFLPAPAGAVSHDVFFSDDSEDEEPALHEFRATAIPTSRSSQGSARWAYRGVLRSRTSTRASICAAGALVCAPPS